MNNFSSGALQRRLTKKPGTGTSMGTPGPRGGKKKLAPSNSTGAGSMFQKGQPGRLFKALHNAPKPR